MRIQTCHYSGEPFRPKCPVTECPAFVDNSESGCAFLEINGDKNKLGKNDMSRLFGVSPATANKKFSLGKDEVRDMARLAIVLTEISITPGERITLEGVYFSNFTIPVTRKSLREAARNPEVRQILKRRMIKSQYQSIFKKRKVRKVRP